MHWDGRRVRFPICGIPILARFLCSIRPARSAILSLIASRSAFTSRGALNSASRKPSGEPGGEVDLNQPSTERRRSERLSESLPLIVRGIDLLGQPFEERTTTLAFNLHGCRYTSKHHLPRNTWVTLDLPQGMAQGAGQPNAGTNSNAGVTGNSRPTLRARVAWVQRPHSIRDFFQIAVELESPANIWGTATAAEWNNAAAARMESANPPARSIPRFNERPERNITAGDIGNSMDHFESEAKIDSREIHTVAATCSCAGARPRSDESGRSCVNGR